MAKALTIDPAVIRWLKHCSKEEIMQFETDRLAFTRVSPSLRRNLERLQLTDAIGHDLIFATHLACLAAYQVASAEPSQGGAPTS